MVTPMKSQRGTNTVGKEHSGLASRPSGERLQKVLAGAGYGSRRQCEVLILAGRVEVDRKIVLELGTRADLATQEVRVDGESIRRQKCIYYLVNKPSGVVATGRDPSGRTRVIDLVPSQNHLFTVGRLDRTSEGLILVTNDGELSNRLAHPRYGVEKTYVVEVGGHLSAKELARLRRGIHLAEALAKVVRIKVKRVSKRTTTLELVLNEGHNREIRRMLARVGHKVLRLRRTALGPLRLGNLPTGATRSLTRDEVTMLRRLTDGTARRKSGKRQRQNSSK